MAQLINVVALLVLMGAVALYANFVLRRIAGIDMRSPTKMPWPRGWRLAAFWFALVISVVVLIPAAIFAAGYLTGLSDCPADLSPQDPWRCTAIGRLLFMAGGIAVGLPLAALWARLLVKLIIKQS
jgi:NADH:ubiquinone oxidoreductase subunit 6 (subunit J)